MQHLSTLRGIGILLLVAGLCRAQDPAAVSTDDKDPLAEAVAKATLIVVARVDSAEHYRGMGGGLIGVYRLKIKHAWKGKEDSGPVHFTLQLTSHDSQPEFMHPDPHEADGDIVLLLTRRRIAEGDVWYNLVSREKPTWWEVESTQARHIKKLVSPESQ